MLEHESICAMIIGTPAKSWGHERIWEGRRLVLARFAFYQMNL